MIWIMHGACCMGYLSLIDFLVYFAGFHINLDYLLRCTFVSLKSSLPNAEVVLM